MTELKLAYYTYHQALIEYDSKAITNLELTRIESNLVTTYGPDILLRFTRWSESILKANLRSLPC
jgi:hypothetical protein